LAQFRDQITDNDRAIVDAVNKRLKLVAQIKRYKEARGLPFLDTAREEWMLRYLSRANRGPLSEQGLRELYTEILDLTKREVTRSGDAYGRARCSIASGEATSSARSRG